MEQKLILRNKQALGDTLVMTAAIRDLVQQAPHIRVMVDTSVPEVWENNPHLSKFPAQEGTVLQLGYSSSIGSSNQRFAHFISGFHQHASELLKFRLRVTKLRPDLHLSEAEKDPEKCPIKGDFWLINAGGKLDFTAKVWTHSRWQKLVDLLKNDIQLVQIGRIPTNGPTHQHRSLTGVTDMLNKTGVRQLMSLVHHSKGVACCVTGVMHMAAALNRTAVVIDGGREPWWWEAYTKQTWALNATEPPPEDMAEHRYLTTIGKLDCCKHAGCWRSGIGEKAKGNNCMKLIDEDNRKFPTCLSMIEPEQVAQEIRAALSGACVGPSILPPQLKPPLFMENLAQQLPKPKSLDEQRREGMKKRTPVVHAVKPTPPVAPQAAPTKETLLAQGFANMLPLTICVLTYGKYTQLLQRAVTSVYNTVPSDVFELRIGLNAVGDESRILAERFKGTYPNVRVYESTENIYKYPMMRRMFWDEPQLATPWTIWMDDDSYCGTSDWLPRLLRAVRDAQADVAGCTFFSHPKGNQREWIKQATWYKGRPMHQRRSSSGVLLDKIDFVTGGFWLAKTSLLKATDWPDRRIKNNGGDIMFGEACNQADAKILRHWHGMEISKHPRRGASQAHPGI